MFQHERNREVFWATLLFASLEELKKDALCSFSISGCLGFGELLSLTLHSELLPEVGKVVCP